MRDTDIILNIHRDRGSKGLPLERVYKHLLNPELFLQSYGKIYRNAGATTKGTTEETADGMSLRKIHNIIDLLRKERYVWTPVRRTEIPKANGKKRPLGIPTWSDKLVQEALRSLMEPYYEQRFSDHCHGFRPGRGCHTALLEVSKKWKGTIWFIEGDIKGAFDNVDQSILLEITRRDIHDSRFVRLIENLLKAGYMEGCRYFDTFSGTPQGGIISPLLFNIYLNELDKFIESTLIPAYTKGKRRRSGKEYTALDYPIRMARRRDDLETVQRLTQERRTVSSVDNFDPNYRRLRYVRYADDFLLGFAGPKKEAEEIRDRLAEFLSQKLRLTLSMEKTFITHAVDEKAKFLSYEIKASRANTAIDAQGRRSTNGVIALLMPQQVAHKIKARFSEKGKIIHRTQLLTETDHTIVQRYQSVLRGIYNYYCMAVNVSKRTRMAYIKWVLETSLTKTLARKHKCSVTDIYEKYKVVVFDRMMLRVVVERRGKEPLVAVFGGIPFERKPEGLGTVDFWFNRTWGMHANPRSEVVQRLLAGKCELCGAEGPVEMHHVRKLADLDQPGRKPKVVWQKVMSARKRKTLAVCEDCHEAIHAGKYDGPPLVASLESRMR